VPCNAGDIITPHTGSNALALVIAQLENVAIDQSLIDQSLTVLAAVLNNATAGTTTLSHTDVVELANVALYLVQSRPQETISTLQKVNLLRAFGGLVRKLVDEGSAQPSTVDMLIETVASFSGEFSAFGADQSALASPLVHVLDSSLLNATRDLVHLGSSGARTFTSAYAVVSVEVPPRPPRC
jgi:hypothetical protein